MKSLCDNCKSQKNCSLTSTKKEIYDCSEYNADIIFSDIRSSVKIQQNYSPIKPSNGLCTNCDFENICSFNEFGTVEFSCEHYQ